MFPSVSQFACVTLGKSLDLSAARFPICTMEIMHLFGYLLLSLFGLKAAGAGTVSYYAFVECLAQWALIWVEASGCTIIPENTLNYLSEIIPCDPVLQCD